MTDERWAKLMANDKEKLTPEELADGWHFCVVWDGLLVGPGMTEQEDCTCTALKRL